MNSETALKLQDKVAIITGAASGIGEAVARRYLDEGAKVVVVDVKDEGELAQRFTAIADRVLALRGDVTKREDIQRIVDSAVERFGGVDILFNNAALFDMRPILDESWDVYDRLFAVNVKGMFFLMQTVAKRMVEQGRGGKIINMSSQAGRRGEALVSHYCATKAAVISYTQSAALALAKERINVNGIAPGVVDTPMWEQVDALFAKYENRPLGEKKRLVGEEVPLGRMGLPADLTGAALFLASADSDYITAQTLNVDGGNWMS
ncbi:sorbitol dehydrogenase [Caballeronia arationis]|jgi:D-sorbitol dehydrogenase (acceptor)|nr:sorbitol dehydrogenase [Caballeronia arationis]